MKTETSIVFTGDIGFDRYFDGCWKDPDILSASVLDFLHSADHVCANVEGAVIKVEPGFDPTGKGMFCHSMDPEAICVLNRMQADIWCLANNHTMDMGLPGMESTLTEASKAGAATVGSGLDIKAAAAPVYLNEAGGIGIIAVGYQPVCIAASENSPGCLAWDNMELIEQTVKKIKETCRWCIVISHGGEEFTNLPAVYVRDRYIKYLEFGADAVIGHHPHVAMNYELFGNKVIFYSLGNFIFDTDYQRQQFNTDRGVLVKLVFKEDSFDFEGFGTSIDRDRHRVTDGPLPAIFTDVPADEYEKLIPLSEKVFLESEKKRKRFVDSRKYGPYTEKDWDAFFRKGGETSSAAEGTIIPGVIMDYKLKAAIADKAEEGAWKESRLKGVVDYLTAQL